MPRSPPIAFDRVATCYDATRGLPDEVEARVQRALAERLGSDRTLEAGFGTGRHFTRLFPDERLHLTGVDVSVPMLQVARSRGATRVLRADARRLPFRAGSFERSLTSHLLHLSAEWPVILAELSRVTRREYLSVLEHQTDSPDLGEEYRRRAEQAGYAVRPPGVGERVLAERLPPDGQVEVATAEFETPANELLGQLELRSFWSQWQVPDSAHARILRELRAEHSAGRIRSRLRVVLAVWSIPRLREFAQRTLDAGS